jgi:hypothetical protein
MSKLCLVIVMMLIAGRNSAQNYPAPGNQPLNYFVLIQAEDGQAFYVRLNDKLYGSSPAGHLILSQLQDSIYTITVGFQGQRFPEQRYLLTIHEKDWFLRLIWHDNRWALLDDREQPLVTVADPAPERPLLTGTKKDDAFSQLMSAIVQDTAVMYNTYSAGSPDSAPPSAPASATATTIAQSNPAGQTTALQTTTPQTATLQTTTPQTATLQTATPQTITAQTASSRTATPEAKMPIVQDSTGLPGINTNPGLAADTTTSHLAAPASSPTNPARAKASDSLSPTGISVASRIAASTPSAPTGVVKLSERKSAQSLNLIFADHPTDKKADTIDVVIPVDSPATTRSPPPPDTPRYPPFRFGSPNPVSRYPPFFHSVGPCPQTRYFNLGFRLFP